MWQVLEEDADYLNIVRLIQQRKMKEEVKTLHVDGIDDYLDIWNLLCVLEERDKTLLVYKNDKIVPPLGFKKRLLVKLHLLHMGVENTKRAASSRY